MSIPIGSDSRPSKKRASDRRLRTRNARDNASSALERATSELAEEKTRSRELETRLHETAERLNVFIYHSASLRQELSERDEELACLRAADAPNILQSIELVLRYHRLVVGTNVHDPLTPVADSDPAPPLDSNQWDLGSVWPGSDPYSQEATLGPFFDSFSPPPLDA